MVALCTVGVNVKVVERGGAEIERAAVYLTNVDYPYERIPAGDNGDKRTNKMGIAEFPKIDASYSKIRVVVRLNDRNTTKIVEATSGGFEDPVEVVLPARRPSFIPEYEVWPLPYAPQR